MISARNATPDDSADVFLWRNDPQTRAMSHVTDPVERKDHDQWFAAALADHNRRLIICEHIGSTRKLAVVRFDISGDQALISINLAPDMRGKGLAAGCLRAALATFEAASDHVTLVNAEIKEENEPSRRAFEAAGFEFVKKSDGVLFYKAVVQGK